MIHVEAGAIARKNTKEQIKEQLPEAKRQENLQVIKIPLANNQKEGYCFDVANLYHTGHQLPYYLNFIKFIAILLFFLSLTYTLPLTIIIINNQGSNNFVSSDSFLISLSVFSASMAPCLDTLAYLSIPLQCIHIVVLILLSFKLKQIQTGIEQTCKFPTSYGLLLRLPSTPKSEFEVCNEVEAWFKTEMKLNKSFFQQFPELENSQDLDSQQNQSDFLNNSTNAKKLQSPFIESVLLSFNYNEYLKLRQEVDYLAKSIKEQNSPLKSSEMNEMIDIYNRKRNILNILPKNQYCLVIFKYAKFAKYFKEKTSGNIFSNVFCPETYGNFQLEGQKVDVVGDVFPNEIFWQFFHYNSCQKTKHKLFSIAVTLVCISVGIGFQFGSIFLRLNNIIAHEIEIVYTLLSAFLVNLIVFIANKLISLFSHKEIHSCYSQQKKSFILMSLIANVTIFTLSPLAISCYIDASLIYSSNGFISSQLFTLLFFILFTILNIYTCSASTSQVQVAQSSQADINESSIIIKQNSHQYKIEHLLSSHLTVLSITYFLAPMFPIIIPFAFWWFMLIFAIERVNIVRFYKCDQVHGSKLLQSMIIYYRRLTIWFIASFVFVISFTANNFSYSWSLPKIIIISVFGLIWLLFQVINFDGMVSYFYDCWRRKQQPLLDNHFDASYSKLKEQFQMLYENFNLVLMYSLKQAKKRNNYSTRIKIYEELNTMSKTLSLSLKEKLFNNLNPIINNEKRFHQIEDDHVNDLYFEYEKKIHMNKMVSKVSIPLLFKKQEVEKKQEPNVEMMNFNSIFSSDDVEARKMLKRHILNKLHNNAVDK